MSSPGVSTIFFCVLKNSQRVVFTKSSLLKQRQCLDPRLLNSHPSHFYPSTDVTIGPNPSHREPSTIKTTMPSPAATTIEGLPARLAEIDVKGKANEPNMKIKLLPLAIRNRFKKNRNLSSQTLREDNRSSGLWLSEETIDSFRSTDSFCSTESQPSTRPNEKQDLPDCWYFSSNHILVNRERALEGLPQLKRCRFLDDIARFHAQDMADAKKIFHSVQTIQELQAKTYSDVCGENIQRGKTIRRMHDSMMAERKKSRKNILSPNFLEFGMGTAKDSDGKLYMVQIFRGEARDDKDKKK